MQELIQQRITRLRLILQNLSVTAVNLVNTTVNGTYAVSSELNVFLKLNFQVTLRLLY
jgi:hypothetical protein